MSYPAKMNPKEKIMISTTIEARNSSVRVGQDTLFISASTAIRKSAKPGTLTRRYDTHSAGRQQQHRAARYWYSGPLPAISEAEPQQAQRDRRRQRGEGNLPRDPALAPLVNADVY